MNIKKAIPGYFLFTLLFYLIASVYSCKESVIENEYAGIQSDLIITRGACGTISYIEKIGRNYNDAFAELEKRKKYEYTEYCPGAPCAQIELEPYEIEVMYKNNKIPRERFFAIQILDKDTGIGLQSVQDVITTKGDLYWINWCPDKIN
jgi:hypothetical protein